LAGEWLNEQEKSGTVLCLLHEQNNVGLTQRCDRLQSVYSGGGEQIDISAGIDQLQDGLVDSDAAVMVALNVDTTAALARALSAAERSDITLIGSAAGRQCCNRCWPVGSRCWSGISPIYRGISSPSC
jgi:hypothetical protein